MPTSAVAMAPSHSTGPEMKQWRRAHRSALRMQPVPIHANAAAHMEAVHPSDRPRKLVDTPRAIGAPHQNAIASGWRDQSVDLPGVVGTLMRHLISVTATPVRVAFGACNLHGR